MKSLRLGNSLCSRHMAGVLCHQGVLRHLGGCSLRNTRALPAWGAPVEQDGFEAHVCFLTKATLPVSRRKDFHTSCRSDPTCTLALPEHVSRFQFRKQGPRLGRRPHVQGARADGRHPHIHQLIRFLQEPRDADGIIALNLPTRETHI